VRLFLEVVVFFYGSFNEILIALLEVGAVVLCLQSQWEKEKAYQYNAEFSCSHGFSFTVVLPIRGNYLRFLVHSEGKNSKKS
jgi:hypothetical protein